MKKWIMRILLGLFIIESLYFQYDTLTTIAQNVETVNQNAHVLQEVVNFIEMFHTGMGM